MAESSLTYKDISVRLYKANAIKFGSFTTQSGAVTPVYFDLRVIVSYPSLMKDLSILLSRHVQELLQQNQNNNPPPQRTVLCGVPLAAIPMTSLVSVNTDLPMIVKRKQAKSYGTKEIIEGVWNKGDTCILVDDVIMFGDSILETVAELKEAGLKCSQAVVICDREQGAIEKAKKRGIEVYALLTLTEILNYLLEENHVTTKTCNMVKDYLAGFAESKPGNSREAKTWPINGDKLHTTCWPESMEISKGNNIHCMLGKVQISAICEREIPE